MTDENQASESAPVESTDTVTAPNVSESVTTDNVVPSSSEEKMIPQSVANTLIGTGKTKGRTQGYGEGYKAAQTEYNQNLNAAPSTAENTQQTDVPQMSQEDIKRIIGEEAQNKEIETRNNDGALKFKDNLDDRYNQLDETGKKEFIETVAPLELGKIPINMVHVLNSVDNIGEVLQDIAKRCPEKFPEIVNASVWSPELARKSLMNIANSIKVNKEAAGQPRAPEPLSQIKASTAGIDSGKMTVDDYRKIYKG